MTNTVVSETNPCVSEAMALLGEANDLTYACRVKIIEARSQGLRCENCTVCPDTCRVAFSCEWRGVRRR